MNCRESFVAIILSRSLQNVSIPFEKPATPLKFKQKTEYFQHIYALSLEECRAYVNHHVVNCASSQVGLELEKLGKNVDTVDGFFNADFAICSGNAALLTRYDLIKLRKTDRHNNIAVEYALVTDIIPPEDTNQRVRIQALVFDSEHTTLEQLLLSGHNPLEIDSTWEAMLCGNLSTFIRVVELCCEESDLFHQDILLGHAPVAMPKYIPTEEQVTEAQYITVLKASLCTYSLNFVTNSLSPPQKFDLRYCTDNLLSDASDHRTGGFYVIPACPPRDSMLLMVALLHVLAAAKCRVVFCSDIVANLTQFASKFLISGGGRLGSQLAQFTGKVAPSSNTHANHHSVTDCATTVADMCAYSFSRRICATLDKIHTSMTAQISSHSKCLFDTSNNNRTAAQVGYSLIIKEVGILQSAFQSLSEHLVARIPVFLREYTAATHDQVINLFDTLTAKLAAVNFHQKFSMDSESPMHMRDICGQLQALSGLYSIQQHSDRLCEEYVRTADILFTTVGSYHHPAITRSCTGVSVLVVDNAASVSEPELLLPLSLRPQSVMLFGDLTQLPITGATYSLMHRLHNGSMQNSNGGQGKPTHGAVIVIPAVEAVDGSGRASRTPPTYTGHNHHHQPPPNPPYSIPAPSPYSPPGQWPNQAIAPSLAYQPNSFVQPYMYPYPHTYQPQYQQQYHPQPQHAYPQALHAYPHEQFHHNYQPQAVFSPTFPPSFPAGVQEYACAASSKQWWCS